ncbi:hypothetical protein NMG60_11009471 [Bertholletia excelsa]
MQKTLEKSPLSNPSQIKLLFDHMVLSRPLSFTLLLVLLFLGSAVAIRPMMPDGNLRKNQDLKKYYRYEKMVLNVLPKGVPIPPSGPSNRHNSVVNSSPPS